MSDKYILLTICFQLRAMMFEKAFPLIILFQIIPLTHWGREKNGHPFPDGIFKRIFLNANVWSSIDISLKFVPKGPINNIPALVQIMSGRRPDEPLPEQMMVTLLTVGFNESK